MSIKPVDVKDTEDLAWTRTVKRAVAGLRYGSVEVLVHDGRVVQVETREKVRFGEDRRSDDRRRNEREDGRAHRNSGGTVPPGEETIE